MTLDRYLVKQFFPVFLIALSMFIMLLCLIDLFANLVRYLNNEVSAINILKVTALYLPKSFSFALPISLLFASAYILGDLYARNELTSVFAAGVPFRRFSFSLLVIGVAASVFSFVFDDRIVIPTLKSKNELSRILLRQQRPENRSDIVIKARNGQLIYAVDYFDYDRKILNGVSIISQDDKGHLVYLIRTPTARWKEDHWELENSAIYQWNGDFLQYSLFPYTTEFTEEPDTFRRNMVNVEDLHFNDARMLVKDLKMAGLPFINALSDFHHRFSFASVPFVVIFLSISMGGRFKKNILLMSLLSSLVAAVIFYVTEMITMMMAKLGYIPPLVGAWFPVFIFILLGFLLLKSAKT